MRRRGGGGEEEEEEEEEETLWEPRNGTGNTLSKFVSPFAFLICERKLFPEKSRSFKIITEIVRRI